MLVVLIGGSLFTMRLKEANERTGEQLHIATRAREAEGVARREAQGELDRANLLLANALVGQGRREEAIRLLLSIPEEKRFWEWGFLFTRAMPDLWEVPFRYEVFSPTKNLAIGFSAAEGLCLLRAETGEVLGRFPTSTTDGLRAKFSIDEAVVALSTADLPPTVMDSRTGAILATIDTGTTDTVTALEPSPDGSRLAVGQSSGRVFIHDLRHGARSELTPHTGPVADIFWGGTHLVSLSTDSVWRHGIPDGTATLLWSQTAQAHPHRIFLSCSDRSRRWFAFALEHLPAVCGLVEEGDLESLPTATYRMRPCTLRPWLVVSSATKTPTVLVWDVEKKERVALEPPYSIQVEIDPGRGDDIPAGGVPSLSRDEDLVLLPTGSPCSFRLLLFPYLRDTGEPAEIVSPGSYHTELMPNGRAAWVVYPDRTVIRAIGAPYPGTRVPGHTSSIGPGDAYTSALQLYWFEQRDTEFGDILFMGGRYFNLYLGGRNSTDGRVIFIPGYRNGVFTIEKAERSTSRVLGRYEWPDTTIGPFALQPDRQALAILDGEGTRATVWSLADSKAERLFDLTPPGGEPMAGISFNPDGRLILTRGSTGRIEVFDASTGRHLRGWQAHQGQVTGFLTLKARGLLATIGADGRFRTWTQDDYSPVDDVSFGFEPQGMACNPEGTRVLAWPAEGAPVLRSIADGAIICSLDRTDFPMLSVRFLSGGARIVASAGGAARFWDTRTGRETYSMDQGFGSISEDERRMVHKTEEWQGTLIDIFPARTAELPGDPSMSVRDRVDLWRIARYRKWSAAQHALFLHNAYFEVAADGRTLGDVPQRNVAAAIWHLRHLTRPIDSAARMAIHREFARYFMAKHGLPDDLAVPRQDEGITQGVREGLVEFPELARESWGLAAISLGAHRARLLQRGETTPAWGDFEEVALLTSPVEDMARCLELRGDRERALATARWIVAQRLSLGLIPGQATEITERLGGTIPSPPRADQRAAPAFSLPAPVIGLGPPARAGIDPKGVRDALDALRAEFDRRREEYLSAYPPPDFAALAREAESDPQWQPLDLSQPASAYIHQFKDRILSLTHDGVGIHERRQREMERVDEAFAFKTHPRTQPP